MMFMDAGATVVLGGAPVPTACMLQAVISAVMSAVAAINEISRMFFSSGAGRSDSQHRSMLLPALFPQTRGGAVLCGTKRGGDRKNRQTKRASVMLARWKPL